MSIAFAQNGLRLKRRVQFEQPFVEQREQKLLDAVAAVNGVQRFPGQDRKGKGSDGNHIVGCI